MILGGEAARLSRLLQQASLSQVRLGTQLAKRVRRRPEGSEAHLYSRPLYRKFVEWGLGIGLLSSCNRYRSFMMSSSFVAVDGICTHRTYL